MSVARVEVDKAGKIIVVVGEPGKAGAECNEWDKKLAQPS
jgi:hypothetical protein